MKNNPEGLFHLALVGVLAAIVLPNAQRAGIGIWGGIGWLAVILALLVLGSRLVEFLNERLYRTSAPESSNGTQRNESTNAVVPRVEAASETVVDTEPRQPSPSELSSTWEYVGQHARGRVIAVSFGGIYPPGSAGNDLARRMIEFLRSVLTEAQAVGVIVDLCALDYSHGDAIAGLAGPLLDEDERFRPAAVVAAGQTARALEPLFAPPFLPAVAGMKLVATRHEALAHIDRAL